MGPTFKNVPNEMIVHEGKEIWISRSVAVCGIVSISTPGGLYALTGIRGSGMPDNVGKRNFICGYLDNNEEVQWAVAREIWEEAGLDIQACGIDVAHLHNWKTLSKGSNVTLVYSIHLNMDTLPPLSTENSEPNEVESVKWMLVRDLLELPSTDWTFNHSGLCQEWMEWFWRVDEPFKHTKNWSRR